MSEFTDPAQLLETDISLTIMTAIFGIGEFNSSKASAIQQAYEKGDLKKAAQLSIEGIEEVKGKASPEGAKIFDLINNQLVLYVAPNEQVSPINPNDLQALPPGTGVTENVTNTGMELNPDIDSAGKMGDNGGKSDVNADVFKPTPELENHIKYVDPSVARSNGIGGAHNSEEFFKNDVKIVKTVASKDIPGVTYYEYSMPLLGKDGKPVGGYGKTIFQKTVYDPKIFSHSEYIKRGLEAASDFYRRNGNLVDYWEGYDSQGVKWIGFGKEGWPTSFFPDVLE